MVWVLMYSAVQEESTWHLHLYPALRGGNDLAAAADATQPGASLAEDAGPAEASPADDVIGSVDQVSTVCC